jgi:hypothetical protein
MSHYNGNRAPFGVYTHPFWLGPSLGPGVPDGSKKLQAVINFLKFAMAQPDVWMVTHQQLIAYMQNPVPASQLHSQSYMRCDNNPILPNNICNGAKDSTAEPQKCVLPNALFQVIVV